MIFGKSDHCEFTFNNAKVDIVMEYKYLGVVFNSVQRLGDSPFKTMISKTADKSLRASFVQTKKVKYLCRIPPKVYTHLFDSLTLSVLEYACEIWSAGKHHDQLERIQLRFFKTMLGFKDSTATAAVYSELK